MVPQLDNGIPLVAVCNISETFYDFLSRAEVEETRARLIRGEQYRGDRALMWLTDPKLVFASFPIPHAEYLCSRFGYSGTQHTAPAEPSPWLSLDILRERPLLDRLIEYAGPQRAVQIVPYATTPQFLRLVEVLRAEHGLTVLLPETFDPSVMWLRDYIDTKTGFRVLASRWLPDADVLLPQGFVCQTSHVAAQVAHWFSVNGKPCVIKADDGENGIGTLINPEGRADLYAIRATIDHDAFLRGNLITVEEYIPSSRMLSPSLELFVPPPGQGEPAVTYLSRQIFLEFGDFCGVLVSKDLVEAPWSRPLTEAGQRIARQLQAMGYVGHFDLDAVVDDNERVYLLEINPRRTGGTHVHEFAWHFFGPDYLDRVSLLSHDAMSSGPISDVDTLLHVVGDLLYPMGDPPRGVIVSVTSALEVHEFGCMIVASNSNEAVALQRMLTDRIKALHSEAILE